MKSLHRKTSSTLLRLHLIDIPQILVIMSSKINRLEYFIDPNDFGEGIQIIIQRNKANAINKIPPIPIHHSITRKLAAQIANKQQKPAVEITKPPISVAPIINEIEDCIIIDAEDYKATGYSDVPMFVQHPEAMMEEIDRMDEEIEMEDAEDWSVLDIDSSDKKNELIVVEYIDDIYAYCSKAEEKLMVNALQFNMIVPTTYVFMWRFLKASQPDRKVELVSFFLIELCLVEYEVLRFPPSMLAAAAVYCSMHSWCVQGVEQNLECSKLMVSFHRKAAVGKLTGVHRKYMSKYGNAARCEPSSFLLEA
ncbi:Cyclin-B2-2 [Capsicum chinense]|nr:Cyclin-B2-2 [Capsicum chinense]